MRSPFVARVAELVDVAPDHLAVREGHETRTRSEIWSGVRRAAGALGGGAACLGGRRVAILLSPGAGWVEAFIGVIAAGGVAVPLSPLYPANELAWFAEDAGADTVLLAEELDDRGAEIIKGRRVVRPGELRAGEPAPVPLLGDSGASDTALLLYTSGTTGKPKGARITHGNVAIQAELLRAAWGCGPNDTLLHALPLHHLHGLGISLCTTILAGAAAHMLPRFEAKAAWEAMASGDVSVWMAVPTMYQKLIEAFDAAPPETRTRWAAGARKLRLATSGSAALPVTLAGRWRDIAGSIPLERFGMTEIGVGMSNPLDPSGRRAGSVGRPLPSVETRILDDAGAETPSGPGELHVRGPSVFPGYWNREDATRDAFDGDWFKTGDVAVREGDGYVRLLGRTSVDILKSGGYKLSALEIEETLREHEAIAEVAVVGLPDETWGDRVVAVVVANPDRASDGTPDRIRAWAKERLPPYKVPREVVILAALPRNALGKVVKPAPEAAQPSEPPWWSRWSGWSAWKS